MKTTNTRVIDPLRSLSVSNPIGDHNRCKAGKNRNMRRSFLLCKEYLFPLAAKESRPPAGVLLSVVLLTLFTLGIALPGLMPDLHSNTSAHPDFKGMFNGNAPAGPVSKEPVRSLLYANAKTKIYARLMPFFGAKGHVDVGYDSADPEEVHKQVEDMISRGIDGAILDWYGPDNHHHNRVALLVRQEAEKHAGFQFAISEDHGALKNCARQRGCDQTKRLVDDLNYAHDNFERSPAYVRLGERPVVMFFDVEKRPIDWQYVRKVVSGNPLFVFRNSGAFSLVHSDGGYAWIGDTKEGQNGMPYLTRFYKRYFDARQKGPEVIFGSVYKGFDDRAASWSKNRIVPQDCGQTWLRTFAEINQRFSADHPLDALQIITWNDYEEGTEIETGIENCAAISASHSGPEVNWKLIGNENTIDHYTVWVLSAGNATQQLDVQVGKHSLRLAPDELHLGSTVYIEAVGKACIRNHFSSPIRF